jgi:DNA repair protein RecO (recombination protein O)
LLYKDEAVVLRTMRLGEADKIVTLLGRAHGKIRAVAKGVRKTKSRFGGRLEPFGRVTIVAWQGKSGLDTINQVDVVDSFRQVREDLDMFGMGHVMLEAIDRVVQERERAPRSFSLLIEGLEALRNGGSQLALAGFLMRLCGIAGFGASLDKCSECGSVPAWFSPVQGGAVCPRCRSADSEEVGTGVLELLSDVVREGAWIKADPEVTATALRLSRFYAEYHLERRLKAAATATSMWKSGG